MIEIISLKTMPIRAAVVATALGLSGCAQFQTILNRSAPSATESPTAAAEPPAKPELPPVPEPQQQPVPGKLFEWNGDGHQVTHIVIDTNEQTARFYAGDAQVGWSTVASGLASHPTPRGEFEILDKSADKRSNLYGKIVNASGAVVDGNASANDRVPPGGRFVGASMPNFMRMTYDGIGMHAGPIPKPGHPASHGCIRMPKQVAKALFRAAPPGTRVTVIGDGPDYGNYAERVRAERAAQLAAARAAEQQRPIDALDAEIGADTPGTSSGATSSRPESRSQSRPPAPAAKAEPPAAADSGAPVGPPASGSAASGNVPAAPPAAGSRAGGDAGSGSGNEAAPPPASTAPRAQAPASPATPAPAPAPGGDVPEAAPEDFEDAPDYGPPAPPPEIRSAATPTPPRSIPLGAAS